MGGKKAQWAHFLAAAEREANNLKGFEVFCLKTGSSRDQNPALTVLFVPKSVDSISGGSRQQECGSR
jgi:hypothetical protein